MALLITTPSVQRAGVSASAANWAKLILGLKKSPPAPSMDLQSDPGALLFNARNEFRDLFRRCNDCTLLQNVVLPDCSTLLLS
jgi:hypothetical protein